MGGLPLQRKDAQTDESEQEKERERECVEEQVALQVEKWRREEERERESERVIERGKKKDVQQVETRQIVVGAGGGGRGRGGHGVMGQERVREEERERKRVRGRGQVGGDVSILNKMTQSQNARGGEYEKVEMLEREVERLQRLEFAMEQQNLVMMMMTPRRLDASASQEAMRLEEQSLLLQQQMLQQKKLSLLQLEKEVVDLSATGVEVRAVALRCAREACHEFGDWEQIQTTLVAHAQLQQSVAQLRESLSAQRRKEQLLKGMLVESEARISTLELATKKADARVLSVVDDMIELERGVHGESSGVSGVREIVGHERKLAALERQLRNVERNAQQELEYRMKVVPMHTEARLLDLERELADAHRMLSRGNEATHALNRTIYDLNATVEALEGDVTRLQLAGATAGARMSELATVQQTVTTLTAHVVSLERELASATKEGLRSHERAVTNEAHLCSRTFETLSLQEALEAADLRFAICTV